MAEETTANIDYFKVLGVPRLPWLDPDHLKETFLRLSNDLHPDHLRHQEHPQRKQSDAFSQVNAAYQCLSSTRSRTKHLIELESGTAPKNTKDLPPDLMQLFAEIGPLIHEADARLAELSQITSPLLRVQALRNCLPLVEKLSGLNRRINVLTANIEMDLKSLTETWKSEYQNPSSQHLAELTTIYRTITFSERWSSQINERLLQMRL